LDQSAIRTRPVKGGKKEGEYTMNADTTDFFETLLFIADDPDAETKSVLFEGLTVNDFAPEFIEGVEKFIAAFRDHLKGVGFPVEKLDASERSFGGNVYLSLSGHGAGFFDDRDPDIAGLHEIIKAWAGSFRFEELEYHLKVNGDGKIDLSFLPEYIEEQREKLFAVPATAKGE